MKRKRPRVRAFELDGTEYVVIAADVESLSGLTESEREVAQAAVSGLGNREIARRRGVSERTVANQLAGIYKKLNVGSRFELAARIFHLENIKK